MGCDLEVYRARLGTWAARTGWRGQSGNKDSKMKCFLVNTCLCAVVLAVLLVIAEWRKVLDLAWKVRTLCKLCAVGVLGVSSREHSATRVDVGCTEVVEMLRLDWQTVGSGTVKDVNGKDCAY